MYPLKDTSVDRVYVVVGARVVLGFFTIRQKRIRGGGAFAEGNRAPLSQYSSIHTNYIIPHCTTLQYNHNI